MSEKKGVNETEKKTEQKVEQKTETASLNGLSLQDLLLLVKEMKRDEEAEQQRAQKNEMRETALRLALKRIEDEKAISDRCPHKHPESGKWGIDWIPRPSGKPFGYCNRCRGKIDVDHPKYEFYCKEATYGWVGLFEKG
jgi:hypothetical protein